jgi:hypothetical protein
MRRDYPDPEDHEDREHQAAGDDSGHSDTQLSFRTAMIAYAAIAVLCFATLHGDALYLTLLIVGAIALKTWLARIKSRLE